MTLAGAIRNARRSARLVESSYELYPHRIRIGGNLLSPVQVDVSGIDRDEQIANSTYGAIASGAFYFAASFTEVHTQEITTLGLDWATILKVQNREIDRIPAAQLWEILIDGTTQWLAMRVHEEHTRNHERRFVRFTRGDKN